MINYYDIYQPMKWKTIDNTEEFEHAISNSFQQTIAIFKHSTRCSISFVAKKTIERFWAFNNDIYYIDLIQNRNISNLLASQLNVKHESPQIIVIKDGKAVYHAAHGMIDIQEISEYL